MKTILLVDDDEVFATTLAATIRTEIPELKVEIAEHGRFALDIMGRIPVDMVITDLDMPEMDGFELLAVMSDRGIKIPVMIVTEFPLTEVQDVLSNLGYYMFYRKTAARGTLVERIKDSTRSETDGYLNGVTIAGLLQLLEAERKNCLVTVSDRERTGQLFIKDGNVIDARTGESQGLDAAMRIVVWNNVSISLSNSFGYSNQQITMKLQDLLLRAFVSQDEFNGSEAEMEAARRGR